MPTNMTVETTQVKKTAESLEEKINLYSAAYQRIYAETTELKVSWKGQSNDKFNQKLETYRAEFEELEASLKKFVEFLISVASAIEGVEDDLTSRAGNLYSGG